jgi:serine/threonine-protein kinase
LQRWLDGRPVAAQPDTATYRMRKFVARHRLAVGSASAVLLALVAGFGTALWQANEARQQAAQARAQVERVTRVKDFVISLFSEGERNSRPVARQRTPLELVDGGIAGAQRDLGPTPELQDDVLGDLLEIKINLGAAAAALEPLDQRIAWRRKHYGSQDTRLADALGSKALALFQLGRFPEAEPLLDESIAILSATLGVDSLPVALQQNRLVRVRLAQSRLDDAVSLMKDVLRKTEAALGPNDPELALRLNNLATLLLRQNKPDEARSALQRSIAILETARGPEHATLTFPLNTLGDVERDVGNFDAALANYERALTILRTEHGDQSAHFAVALNRVGDAQRRRRDFAAAAQTLDQARAIQERGKYAELGDTYARLGDLSADQDDLDRAEDWFRKAHAYQLSTQGERSLLTWTRLGQLSNIVAARGRYDEARALRQQATRGLAALGKGAARETATSRFLEGVIERNAGSFDLALELQQSAFRVIEPLLSADRRGLVAYRVQLAVSLALRGLPDDRIAAGALLAAAGPVDQMTLAGTRANALLALALLEPPGNQRTKWLAALDLQLPQVGAERDWLRKQRDALASEGTQR